MTVVSDNSDDAQQRRIWLEKVVELASGREMVQAWVVTTVYEDILLSLPGGRYAAMPQRRKPWRRKACAVRWTSPCRMPDLHR